MSLDWRVLHLLLLLRWRRLVRIGLLRLHGRVRRVRLGHLRVGLRDELHGARRLVLGKSGLLI